MRALEALDRLHTDELFAFHREVCARAYSAYAATERFQQDRANGLKAASWRDALRPQNVREEHFRLGGSL